MPPKYTIVKTLEMQPILDWYANQDKEYIAKQLECNVRTIQRDFTYKSSVIGWRVLTVRLEKLKALMK